MRHQRVEWVHEHPDEPVVLFSEVGDDGYEIRKLDVFAHGGATIADTHRQQGSTFLSEQPVPELEDILADSQFVGREISLAEFDEVWRLAGGFDEPE